LVGEGHPVPEIYSNGMVLWDMLVVKEGERYMKMRGDSEALQYLRSVRLYGQAAAENLQSSPPRTAQFTQELIKQHVEPSYS
jgi:hypothetical protein